MLLPPCNCVYVCVCQLLPEEEKKVYVGLLGEIEIWNFLFPEIFVDFSGQLQHLLTVLWVCFECVFSLSVSIYRKSPSIPSLSRPLTWRATWILAYPTQPQRSSALPTSMTIPQSWQWERWVLKHTADILLICVTDGTNENYSRGRKVLFILLKAEKLEFWDDFLTFLFLNLEFRYSSLV